MKSLHLLNTIVITILLLSIVPVQATPMPLYLRDNIAAPGELVTIPPAAMPQAGRTFFTGTVGTTSLSPYFCTLAVTTTADSICPQCSFSNPAVFAAYAALVLAPGNQGQQVQAYDQYFRLNNIVPDALYKIEAVPNSTNNYNLGIIAYDNTFTPIMTDTNPADYRADMSFKPTTIGTYYFRISQISDYCTGGSYKLQVTYSPPACTQVTSVDMSVATAGTIYPDTAAAFSADLLPDDAKTPFHYRITIDGMPGAVLDADAEPVVFTHTFDTTGTHTVGIAVWNCFMHEVNAATDTVHVMVYEQGICVPLESITIGGATGGVPGSHTFTTSHLPTDASLPIEYLWDNGDTTASSTRALGVGAHTLAVTATNCTSAVVTDTHQITITPCTIYLPVIAKS